MKPSRGVRAGSQYVTIGGVDTAIDEVAGGKIEGRYLYVGTNGYLIKVKPLTGEARRLAIQQDKALHGAALRASASVGTLDISDWK